MKLFINFSVAAQQAKTIQRNALFIAINTLRDKPSVDAASQKLLGGKNS